MTWYAGNVLIAMTPSSSPATRFLVYENVILIEASSPEKACEEAKRHANDEAELDDKLTIDGVPAKRSFLGIRKVIRVSNPEPLDLSEDRPVSGTEITYSLFELGKQEDLQSLVDGGPVSLTYVE